MQQSVSYDCILIGNVAESQIEIKYQNERYIFEFMPSDTIGKLIGEIEETTGSTCVIRNKGLQNLYNKSSNNKFSPVVTRELSVPVDFVDGAIYSKSVRLQKLRAPFVVTVGTSETLVKGW